MSHLTLALVIVAVVMIFSGVFLSALTIARGRLNYLWSYLIFGGIIVIAAALASHLFG